MSAWYYLVKTNWRPIEAACPLYAGLGGDVWPLDSAAPDLRGVHDEMLRSRVWTPIGNSGAMLCQTRDIAVRYHDVAVRALPHGAWLLAVHPLPVPSNSPLDGYDIGHASGGYSVIESEILAVPGPRGVLNQFGLFPATDALDAFLTSRDPEAGLEELDDMPAVGIRILSKPRLSGA